MDLAQPFVNASPHPSIDRRSTMADLLRQQETIWRDNAEVEAARRRVEIPKPLACDIEAIEHQSASVSEDVHLSLHGVDASL
ncbi:hypothetical protein Plhal304r1_c007g0029951 [Plasmopara halstedii]